MFYQCVSSVERVANISHSESMQHTTLHVLPEHLHTHIALTFHTLSTSNRSNAGPATKSPRIRRARKKIFRNIKLKLPSNILVYFLTQINFVVQNHDPHSLPNILSCKMTLVTRLKVRRSKNHNFVLSVFMFCSSDRTHNSRRFP